MDKFLGTHTLSKLKQEEIENFNRPTTSKEIESVVKTLPARGTWVAQLVKCPTSAQVMVSWFMNSNLTSGSVLTAQSRKPPSDSVSPPLSAPSMLMFCLSLSLNNKYTLKKFF